MGGSDQGGRRVRGVIMKNFSIIALSGLLLMSNGVSADPVLDVVIGGETRQFGRDALLARPDVAGVEIADDVAYRKAMRYRAVPLAALLAGLNPPADSVIETVALDGFAAQLPLDLITNTDPAKPIAWLAIEPAGNPWPPLPGKTASAGPFYICGPGRRRRRFAASSGRIRWRSSRASRRRRRAGPRSASTRRCPPRIRFAPARPSSSPNACPAIPSTAPAQARSAPT